MTLYLRVHVETRHDQEDLYSRIDGDETEEQLLAIGQDMVNGYASWGIDTVDESEVPEGDR